MLLQLSIIFAQGCISSQFVGKNYTIVQTQTDIPLLNVKSVKLNGTLSIEDCAIVLSNFDYYPPFVKTYLYGSTDPDPKNENAEGFKISLDEVQPAVSRNMTYELNGVDKLKDIKVIKFYAEEGKLVLGYVKLADSDDQSKSSSGAYLSLGLISTIIYMQFF
eukprot:NODE_806_length_4082_cov_0.326638.p2 type:complete len:162 gc:universal NODE_806_length_4082_cov_0.326638:186-671(+)